MAFSANILIAKTCSVVPRPGWYAAWSGGMCCFRRSQVLSIKHIVKIFLRTDSKIIGRRFSGGPFDFPAVVAVAQELIQSQVLQFLQLC